MLISCRLRLRLWRAKSEPSNGAVGALVLLSYAVMASSSAEYYRGRAKDCCRRAVITEDVDQRTHWLEAAARWVSLARHEGFLLPAQDKAAPSSDPA